MNIPKNININKWYLLKNPDDGRYYVESCPGKNKINIGVILAHYWDTNKEVRGIYSKFGISQLALNKLVAYQLEYSEKKYRSCNCKFYTLEDEVKSVDYIAKKNKFVCVYCRHKVHVI